MYTGGGISVRVNGTAIDPAKNPAVDGERLPDKKESPEWAKATITWSSGAQRFSDESHPQNSSNNTSSSVVDIKGTSSLATPQLVHVITVKPTSAGDTRNNGNMASKIRITTSSPPYPMDFSKDKISVVVGSSVNHTIKAEDERSSSGASSAPGSDCERSDSDREADDGTDSGFSPARGHEDGTDSGFSPARGHDDGFRGRVSVTTNNRFASDKFDNGNTMKACNGHGGNVKLTIAPYSNKDSEVKNGVVEGDPWDMHFHMKELDSALEDKKSSESDDVQTKIATAHALLSGSSCGTFSFRNRVRSSIVSLLVQSATNVSDISFIMIALKYLPIIEFILLCSCRNYYVISKSWFILKTHVTDPF